MRVLGELLERRQQPTLDVLAAQHARHLDRLSPLSFNPMERALDKRAFL